MIRIILLIALIVVLPSCKTKRHTKLEATRTETHSDSLLRVVRSATDERIATSLHTLDLSTIKIVDYDSLGRPTRETTINNNKRADLNTEAGKQTNTVDSAATVAKSATVEAVELDDRKQTKAGGIPWWLYVAGAIGALIGVLLAVAKKTVHLPNV